MFKFFGRCKKNEKGQTLVEFALVLLPLMLIVLGIIEFGWLFSGRIILTGAAREGARTAAVGKDYDEIKDAVEGHIGNTGITLDLSSPTVIAGLEEITVIVSGDMEPLVGFFVQNSFNMQGQAVMRKE